MVTVGFVVEGDSDKYLVESELFQTWLREVRFSRKFIRDHGFDIRRAARHDQCPSARYFVSRLCALGHPL